MRRKPAEYTVGMWPNRINFRCSPLGVEIREGNYGTHRGSLSWYEIDALSRVPKHKIESLIREIKKNEI